MILPARAALVCFSSVLLLACASTPPDVIATRLPEPAAYAGNPFVPINLYVNANEHVRPARAELLEYAAAELEASGAFVRVDRGTQRWLYTLQLRFRPQAGAPPQHWLRRLLSWISLGLVPVRVPQTEFLDAEIFLEPEPVAKLAYVQPYDDTLSLYRLGDPQRDARAAVDLLLKRLLAEIASTRAVPRARSFEQPLEQKKPPPKLKGQPT